MSALAVVPTVVMAEDTTIIQYYDSDHSSTVTNRTQFGKGAKVTDINGTALGQNSPASGENSTAIGEGVQATGFHSAAVGKDAKASGNQSMAFGTGSQASGYNAVALGASSVADRDNSVSVGSEGHERTVTNVANGWHNTDAVNFRQLREVARYAYSGIAAATALALAMIPGVEAGKTFSIGVGTGGYLGYQAWAVAASGRIGNNLNICVGAGISAASTTWGAGASYSW
jgi:trimeric autotransporter adhesin